MTNILGYARVSTQQQDLDSQRHRLTKAGAIRIFEDVISGKIFDRPGLEALIAYARPNDLLCVVRPSSHKPSKFPTKCLLSGL